MWLFQHGSLTESVAVSYSSLHPQGAGRPGTEWMLVSMCRMNGWMKRLEQNRQVVKDRGGKKTM